MRHAASHSHSILLGAVAVGVALVASAACTQGETIDLGPIGGAGGAASGAGGTGGSSAAGGSGGSGNAGSGGSAGSTAIDLPDSGLVRFSATLQGQTVKLTALDPVWIGRCEKNPIVVQRVNDAWVPLVDDRPDAFNLLHAAHYLDGAYHSDCRLSLGCDVGGCEAPPGEDDEAQFTDYFPPLIARQYVQVGQSSAPICELEDAGIALDAGSDAGSDAGLRVVPSIESRAPSGPLGVRVRYYRDRLCATEAITTDVAVQ